jgi:hypothetical protein
MNLRESMIRVVAFWVAGSIATIGLRVRALLRGANAAIPSRRMTTMGWMRAGVR